MTDHVCVEWNADGFCISCGLLPCDGSPAPGAMNDQIFAAAVAVEVERARQLFPGDNAMNAALVEEVGEVSKALMYEPWGWVVKEAIQVAAMAQRLAVEGDATMIGFRLSHVHDGGRRYMRAEHLMPGQGLTAVDGAPTDAEIARANVQGEAAAAEAGERATKRRGGA